MTIITLSPPEGGTLDLTPAVPTPVLLAPVGPAGARGWSPVLVPVSDGAARTVLKVHDWIDGQGVKPATGSYLGTSGLVAAKADAQNVQGLVGLPGDKGWSPLWAIVADGQREVLRVVDWTGGGGAKPATGLYVGVAGLVEEIEDAKSIRGPSGSNGWTAIEAVVSDGERRVRRITDWVGGTGTKPATGAYLGASGHVVDIADATDVRGPLPEAAGKPSGFIFFMRG